MKPRRKLVLKVACGLSIILLSSCETTHVYRRPHPHHGGWIGNAPPAHAPAHGYRRKQVCGYDLVYDSNWGVYVVVGVTDCYYSDGYFYRSFGGSWQISQQVDSGWVAVSVSGLPYGLAKKARTRVKARSPLPVSATPSPVSPSQIKAASHGKGKGYAKKKR